MGCNCGKPKCDGHCGVSPAVLQINNPSECTLFHRVEVPASMGDSKTNPPKNGAYKNVLLYYEADQTSWLYSSDGIPQKLVNGLTDYEAAINLPQINDVTLLGNKSLDDLGITDAIDDAVAEEKAEREAADEALGDEIDVINEELLSRAVVFETTIGMIANASGLTDGSYVRTLGYRAVDDDGAAFFVIKNTGTADGKSIIALDGGLYAHMIYVHDFVTPEMFGAYGDGVNDHNDSDAIQYAINSGKIVKFAPKTYMCHSLTVDTPAILHGNGATLKRPELDIAPYNMTVAQMKWIRTIRVSANCVLKDLVFDNNCFSMWQLSDGYSQEQSASVIFNNATTKYEVSVEGCKCQYSAGDGLLIINNAKININDYQSYETFRGGITIVGNSEVNIDGWNSQSVTLPDGIDIEIDSVTQTTTPPIINISNVIIDHDVDITVANGGSVTVNNLVMREIQNTATQYGARFSNLGGTLVFNNCVLRRGNGTSTSCFFKQNGSTTMFNNCKLIAPNEDGDAFFYLTQDSAFNSYRLEVNNCDITGRQVISCGNFNGDVLFKNNNVKCVTFNGGIAPAAMQASNFVLIGNTVEFTGSDSVRSLSFNNNQYAPDGLSTYVLYNNTFIGNTSSKVYFGGYPTVIYDSSVFQACFITEKALGARPKFYGLKHLIVVPTSSDLTFAGWVAGDDIAIAKDSGTKYSYTSGTTWTAL